MTVAEFIEWLKTQPQDAIITCISHQGGCSYTEQGGVIEIVDFIKEPTSPNAYNETFDIVDFTSDYFKGKPYHGRKELFIGRRE